MNRNHLPNAFGHCKSILKKYDYEDYLCSLFLPTILKPLKWALGALDIETSRVKTISRNAEICISRLQFWEDSLLGGGSQNVNNPVVLAIKSFLLESRTMTPRAVDLGKAAYYEISQVEEYSERTHSTLLYMLFEFLKINSLELDHAASHLGKAQGLVSLIRSALPLSVREFDPGIPINLLVKQNLSQEELKNGLKVWSSEKVQNVIHEMADIAWVHLNHSAKYLHMAILPFSAKEISTLRRIFLPAHLIKGYLEKLQKLDFDLSKAELYSNDRWLPLKLVRQIYFNNSLY